MKRSNEQTIQEVIKLFLKQNKLEGKFKQAEIKDVWKNMLGPSVANVTRDVYLGKTGTLTVYIDSSLVKQELGMMKTRLVQALNEEMGEELVKEINLR